MDPKQHCAYVMCNLRSETSKYVLCVLLVWNSERKEIIFMLGKTARRKQEMLETSCVKDVQTRTYVSNGLKQSENEVRISLINEEIGEY